MNTALKFHRRSDQRSLPDCHRLPLSALWQTRHLIRKLVRVCIAKIDAIDDRLFSSLSTVRARWSRAIIVGLLVGIAANAIIETTPIEQGLKPALSIARTDFVFRGAPMPKSQRLPMNQTARAGWMKWW